MSGFRLEQHGSTIECFKNSVISPLAHTLWRFPFDISYRVGQTTRVATPPCETLRHMKFSYSNHPRSPNRSPTKIYRHISEAFRVKGKSGQRQRIYTLFDYLHDFRVWANYLDINDMLSLWGQGYKAFLDQNLSTLLFFIGGFAELCVIAVLGADIYHRQAQRIHDLFAANNPELEPSFGNTPVFQRFEIYRALRFTSGILDRPTKEDINRVTLS